MNCRSATIFILSLLVVAGTYSCTATKQITETGEEQEEDSLRIVTEPSTTLDLNALRSSLGDEYITQQHDFPETFMEKYQGDQQKERDPFDGFRIQIASSRRVVIADSIASSFRVWSDTTLAGYQPDTYVFFRQPYYRVHVGDFHNRERAIDLSRLIKRVFPQAWVVHDRINPSLVPPDTVQIGIQTDTTRSGRSSFDQ
ncbi:MAG: SPOR domain-containing protein [Balneolaceae bacterium]|nr:SPOR domain-containing protein [Balneolaceae bacterium]